MQYRRRGRQELIKKAPAIPGASGDQSIKSPFTETTTFSLCPVCLKNIPARISASVSGVFMDKQCRDHGAFRSLVSIDLQTYLEITSVGRKVKIPTVFQSEIIHGCPDDCGLCPAHDQHTCLAILEITDRCDLSCPVCLADSTPVGTEVEIGIAEAALQTLVRSQGDPPALQLSGGEPTLHKGLLEIVAVARSLGFGKVELDTNGLALAQSPALCADLKEAGLSGVYLQMDSLRPESCRTIRGRDLVVWKKETIENCRRAGLQVVMAATVVPGVNDNQLWEMVQFAKGERLTGVNFQSQVRSGRFPAGQQNGARSFTLSHFLREIERQSGQELLASDFNPIPCPDTRCGALAYALVLQGRLIPLGRVMGKDQLLDHTADLRDWDHLLADIDWEWVVDSLCDCSGGCRAPSRADLGGLGGVDFFSIGFHGMMDAHTFDAERAKRCCVHALTKKGRLIPFCLYNIKYRSRA